MRKAKDEDSINIHNIYMQSKVFYTRASQQQENKNREKKVKQQEKIIM